METKTNVVIGNGEITKDLLTGALDAHGGLSRWREIEAFRLKGLPDGLRDVTLRIQARRPIVRITPFGGEARTGTSRQTAYGSRMPMVASLRSVAAPRASFAGHVLTEAMDSVS